MGKKIFLSKASCFLFTVFIFVFTSPKFAYCQQLVGDGNANQLAFIYSLIYLPGSQPLPVGISGLNDSTTAMLPSPTDSLSQDVAVNEKATGMQNDNVTSATHFTNSRADNTLKEMKAALYEDETDVLINKFAEMIELEPEDVENYPLYKFIDKWYGVKYKYGGVDNTGIDCSAFSQKLYGTIFNVNILRTARQQHKTCELIRNYEEASEGDLVFFRIHRIRISHVGIYLANGYFVHASRSRGVMISSLNDKYWQRRYAGCGKVERADVVGTESDYLQ